MKTKRQWSASHLQNPTPADPFTFSSIQNHEKQKISIDHTSSQSVILHYDSPSKWIQHLTWTEEDSHQRCVTHTEIFYNAISDTVEELAELEKAKQMRQKCEGRG